MFRHILRLTGILASMLMVAAIPLNAFGPDRITPEGGATPRPFGSQVALHYAISEPFVLRQDGPILLEPVAAVMGENFEGAWPKAGWNLVDQSTNDGGEFLLGKRNCHPHTASYGGWIVGGGAQGSALGCSTSYPNNANTWAEYGPFDLSQATSATLTYYLWGQVEPGSDGCNFDAFLVGDSINGANYDHGTVYCGDWTSGGDGNGYYRRTLDLSVRLGQPQVWIAFALFSDGSVAYNGMTVDDVTLDVVTPAATPTNTPTPTRTLTPTASKTPTRTRIPTVTSPPGTLRLRAYLPLILRALPPVCSNDPYEPNGTFEQAWGPLPLNQDFLGYFNCAEDTDRDYYYFDLTSRRRVVITLQNIPAGSDYNLTLYNSGREQEGYSGNLGNIDEAIDMTVDAGRHYVRITRGSSPLTSQPYRLRVATP